MCVYKYIFILLYFNIINITLIYTMYKCYTCICTYIYTLFMYRCNICVRKIKN